MKTPLHYGLICLIALMATGCGGSSSSSNSAFDRTINSAPAQAEFFDANGVMVSRMQFQYPDELTINVQQQNIGKDMLWDTEDDTLHLYLQCLYMSASTPLLRYPDLYFLDIARTPYGALELAMLGMPLNGQMMKCPVRSGRRLVQESGYVSSLYTPTPGNGYGYQINAELEHFNGTATESLAYEYDGDSIVLEEAGLPLINDHTQITTVLYDAEQRPLSIDMMVDSPWNAVLDEYCVDGDTIAVAMMFLRTCGSAREALSYRYIGGNVEQDRQHYNGSQPAGIYTSSAIRLEDSVIVHPGSLDDGQTSGARYESYPFNESEKVTAKVSSSYGEDSIWGTEDDLHTPEDNYHYDKNGRLYEVRYATSKTQAYDYRRDGLLKQADEFDSQSDIPWRRTLISYQHGSPAMIAVLARFEYPDDSYVLQTRMVVNFAPSDESWSTLFAPVVQLPKMPPDIDDLMQFRPIR